MKRIVVTGATGFVGRHALSPLLRRGYEVHALYTKTSPPGPEPDMHWHQCDLFDEDRVRALFEAVRPMCLLHLAWETAPGRYWTSSTNLAWTAATLQLLQCFAKNGGKRLVIAGSSAEYAWGNDEELDEIRSPLKPQTLYGKCKNAIREIVTEWAPQEGISWAWGRIFNVFGPHEKPDRLVPKIIGALLAGEEVPFDSGASLRDFLHVADAGDAFAALLDGSVTGPVNIAAGEAVSVRDLVSSITQTLHKPGQVLFDTIPQRGHEHARVVASVRRLHEEVGWRPSTTLEHRLRETCAWWRESHAQQKASK